jgi:hypothetical protein
MDIKIEMMEACKESWLLFFEEKIERFLKGYEIRSVVNNISITKNKTFFR